MIEATLAAMEASAPIAPEPSPCSARRSGFRPTRSGRNSASGFEAADAENARYFAASPERPSHSLFDLPAYIVARLQRAGIGTVADLGLCTYADPERFFSYRRTTHRREGDYGRLVSAITLAPDVAR